jgi:hypothetical protein
VHGAAGAVEITGPDLIEDGAVIGQALTRRAGVQGRQIERHAQCCLNRCAESHQKIIAGRGEDAAMKSKVGFGIGAAVVCTDNLNAGVAVMKSAQDGA